MYRYLLLCLLSVVTYSCGNDDSGRTDCAEYHGYRGDFELINGECVCPETHYYLEKGGNYDCIEKGKYTYKVEIDSIQCFRTSYYQCSPNLVTLVKNESGDFFSIFPYDCMEPKNAKWSQLDDGSVEISFEIHPFLVSQDCSSFANLASCESVRGYGYGRSDTANTKIDIAVTYMDECKDVELATGYIYLRK